jgi:hypothetical protein
MWYLMAEISTESKIKDCEGKDLNPDIYNMMILKYEFRLNYVFIFDS